MKALLCLTTAMLLPFTRLSAEPPSPAATQRTTERVAFAQYCFWTGEMQLGQLEGVVRTEAGHFHGSEVTLVDYDPSRISLLRLATEARRARVADRIHLASGERSTGTAIAGVIIGAPLDSTYRTAPANDQRSSSKVLPMPGSS